MNPDTKKQYQDILTSLWKTESEIMKEGGNMEDARFNTLVAIMDLILKRLDEIELNFMEVNDK